MVGERGGVLVVVRHEQRRQCQLAQQLGELVPHLGLRMRVQRREWLVEEEHRRLVCQRPRQRDALALAARELGRARGGEVPDPEPLEERFDRAAAGTEGDVRPHAQVREEGVVLEDEPDSPPVGREREPERGVEPGLAVERDAAASRLGEPGDDAQRRRLAGAGGPDERDRARDLEREV